MQKSKEKEQYHNTSTCQEEKEVFDSYTKFLVIQIFEEIEATWCQPINLEKLTIVKIEKTQ